MDLVETNAKIALVSTKSHQKRQIWLEVMIFFVILPVETKRYHHAHRKE